MERERFDIAVEADDQGEAGRGAQALADALREADGVLEATRRKADQDTMDLGAIVTWSPPRARPWPSRRASRPGCGRAAARPVTIERDGKSGSIKAAVEGIDPETAERIVEAILGG